MPRIPQRQNLAIQAAEIIEEMIMNGGYKNYLPGERTLAKKLQIGRDTLRSALDIVEKKKLISKRQQGQRRSIYAEPAPLTRHATKRVGFLSPKKLLQLPPQLLAEFDTLRELLQQQAYELELVSPGIFQLQNPDSKLAKLIKDHEVDVWILHQCGQSIQQWFYDHQIPTLVRGLSHESIPLPCIDDDWRSAAFHAGHYLKRMGHQKIGLLMPDTELAGLRATEQGLQESLGSGGGTVSIQKMLDQGDLKSVTRNLKITFQIDNPPTAIIATRSRHVLNIVSWLAKHRLTIPEDLSLIALSSEPWYENLLPTISHYHSDPIMMAKSVTRKVLSLAHQEKIEVQTKLLIPQFFKGKSVKKLPQ